MTGWIPRVSICRLPTNSRVVAPGAALYTFVGGLVSLLGWLLNMPRLSDLDNGIAIQPNAAVAAMREGAALILLGWGRRRATAGLAGLVGLTRASTVFQYLSGIDLEFLNGVLMFDRTRGRVGVTCPGRMGPPGAACHLPRRRALIRKFRR